MEWREGRPISLSVVPFGPKHRIVALLFVCRCSIPSPEKNFLGNFGGLFLVALESTIAGSVTLGGNSVAMASLGHLRKLQTQIFLISFISLCGCTSESSGRPLDGTLQL